MTDSELDLDELESVARDMLSPTMRSVLDSDVIRMIARIRELEAGKEMCELFHSAEPPVTDEELREALTDLTVENMTCSFCSEMKPDETQVICNECNIDAVDQLAALEKKVSELEAKLAESEYKGNSVEWWWAKATAYGSIVHGCSPALKRAGYTLDDGGMEGPARSIALAVEDIARRLAASEKRAEAWYQVHACGQAIGPEMSDPDDFEELTEAEKNEEIATVEGLEKKYSEAKEYAHSIDNRRCPTCKGNFGFIIDGCFDPCPYCDGNPWEEILEEEKYQAEEEAKRESARQKSEAGR